MLTATWHGVQTAIRHKQGPPTLRLHCKLNQILTIIHDATMFLEKIRAQQQWSRFRLIREQMNKDTEVTKSIMSNWESGQISNL